MTAGRSQRSVSCVSCVRDELAGGDEYTRPVCMCSHTKHAHAHIVATQAIKSDTNPQWWCLDYTELPSCSASPTMVRAFISVPVRLLSPFVLVIYTAVYAHTTCKGRCTSMQRECNVGHQTEPTGRVLLFWSSQAASGVIEGCERRGVNAKRKKKNLPKNTGKQTKASSTNC